MEGLAEPVAVLADEGEKRLTELPGIGADLAGKIVEILETGTLSMLAELEKEVPAGTAELMRIPGLGPKRARTLYEKLGIVSLEELVAAARGNWIRELGPKTEEKILHELEAGEPGVAPGPPGHGGPVRRGAPRAPARPRVGRAR